MTNRVLHLDFETCSEIDLRKTGSSVYSQNDTLLVTICAWAFDDEPVQSVTGDMLEDHFLPQEVYEHIKSGGKICAWNIAFEADLLRNYFGVSLDNAQLSCVMQRAQYAGLPAALGDCGQALGLAITKDVSAHRLMLQMARPRCYDTSGPRYWHKEDEAKLATLVAYCERDVAAEREIAKTIPELPPREIELSRLDMRTNNHGVHLDEELIARMLSVADEAQRDIDAECSALTKGAVRRPASEIGPLGVWLGAYAPPDLTKENVALALKRDDLPADIRRVLELRQLAAKNSVKKLKAMTNCAGHGFSARGINVYYGASRTGRNSSRLIQMQNLPRPSIKNPNDAIDFMLKGGDARGLELFYGNPLDVLASCLRGVIIPEPGNKFIVFDLSQIEARLIAWLAGQNDLLEVFARGDDVYTYAAQRIGLNSRQEGKVAVLGLGYGMGPAKFIDTAKTYGLDFTPQRAEEIVKGWREANSKIVEFWYAFDRAIRAAISGYEISERTTVARVNDWVSVQVNKSRNGKPLLTMLLPSGRRLFYRDIEVKPDPYFPSSRPTVFYKGVHQTTRKWEDIKGYSGKWAENCTQAVARDVVFDMALAVDKAGLGDLVLTVHDELIFEVPATGFEARLAKIKTIMNTTPLWAPGLPVAAEGGVMDRYGKA